MSNSFYEASITDTKTKKTAQKLQTYILDERRCKKTQQSASKPNNNTQHASLASGIYPRDARVVQHSPPINIINHISTMKNKNHMVISVDMEQTFSKT